MRPMSVFHPDLTVWSIRVLILAGALVFLPAFTWTVVPGHLLTRWAASVPWSSARPAACWQTSSRTPCAQRWLRWCGSSSSGPFAGSAAPPGCAGSLGCGTGPWPGPARSWPPSTGGPVGVRTAVASRWSPLPARLPVALSPLGGCWQWSAGHRGWGSSGCCSGRPSFRSGLHLWMQNAISVKSPVCKVLLYWGSLCEFKLDKLSYSTWQEC